MNRELKGESLILSIKGPPLSLSHVSAVAVIRVPCCNAAPLAGGECSYGYLYLVPNSPLGLLGAGLFLVATPPASVTTGGLHQVRVSGAVCASTPGFLTPEISTSTLSQKSFGGGGSNPKAMLASEFSSSWPGSGMKAAMARASYGFSSHDNRGLLPRQPWLGLAHTCRCCIMKEGKERSGPKMRWIS
ncbi:unnamed protein product [Schistocephalus solidus]|uniref:Uncharacterized protein n=1 Tax=Schistocephalus solidus TaxID=70667 RepID=A0A183SMQ8_SCHSO|nr:unnamed protein product [Schistocephalus solidus]